MRAVAAASGASRSSSRCQSGPSKRALLPAPAPSSPTSDRGSAPSAAWACAAPASRHRSGATRSLGRSYNEAHADTLGRHDLAANKACFRADADGGHLYVFFFFWWCVNQSAFCKYTTDAPTPATPRRVPAGDGRSVHACRKMLALPRLAPPRENRPAPAMTKARRTTRTTSAGKRSLPPLPLPRRRKPSRGASPGQRPGERLRKRREKLL